jgi:lipopolysaccharide export system protein LptA
MGRAALLVAALSTLGAQHAQAQIPAAANSPSPGRTSAPAAAVTPAAALTDAGLVSIESDLQKADNRTGVITASGNVRIVYPDQRVVATARQAQYYVREQRIVLSGDVDVIQPDGNALRAERVVVLLASQRVIAEPRKGQQVVSTLRLDSRP